MALRATAEAIILTVVTMVILCKYVPDGDMPYNSGPPECPAIARIACSAHIATPEADYYWFFLML
jgi:hypothetical protein